MNDAPGNIAEFSVSDIAFAVKKTVEERFGYVRVRGEVSGYRGPHGSGHVYFTLKDERARLDAVMWKGVFARTRFPPEEGLEMIATGKISTYPGSSKYQIIVDRLQPAGAGALMALLEERRQKLLKEGLFDAAAKKSLPFLPRVIGVITSPTGAVIRDILHRLADRCPSRVIVWPVRVQGETSAAEVTAAINGFNALAPGGAVPRPDVLIVARGGGSIEDLWSFNEEAVVRAAAASGIPLISAVGHETDWTLIDHAADARAPTPTGAAEMAVPVRAQLHQRLGEYGTRLGHAALRALEMRRTRLRAVAAAMPRLADYLSIPRQRIDLAGERLRAGFAQTLAARRNSFTVAAARHMPGVLRRQIAAQRQSAETRGHRARQAIAVYLSRARSRLDGASRMLHALSYQAILARGFALVRDVDERPVRTRAMALEHAFLAIEFSDGRLIAVPSDAPGAPEVSDSRARGARVARNRDRSGAPDRQPGLFDDRR